MKLSIGIGDQAKINRQPLITCRDERREKIDLAVMESGQELLRLVRQNIAGDNVLQLEGEVVHAVG